jgi:MoxR-like ATPase
MFASVEAVQERFRVSRYIASRRIATVVYLASRMNRPVLVEGPAGVGKTELAKVLAETTGRPLVRLQCYEGLDEAKALYEWKYAKQLLYTQMLRERIGEMISDAPSLPEAVDRIARQEDAFFSRRFLSPRPLLGAILADEPVVLLVDEIDKAEVEFEAFLLEVLSDFQISIPEIGTITATSAPLVVLTSNRTRELHDALKRRCLYHWIGYPPAEREVEIVLIREPGVPEALARKVVAAVNRLRELDLAKPPGVAETIDWARTVDLLGGTSLDPQLALDTLGAVVKERDDLELVRDNLEEITSGA